MAAGLADIFAAVRFKLDTQGFEAEAAAAGTKAGKSAGDKMAGQLSSQLKTKLKATLATGLAVGFAAITKQGLELNETLTDVQARSGAVGEQWDRMSETIQKRNRDTTLSLQEIGDGVAALKTDLGVTGEEFDLASSKLTNFGLVAKEVFADSVRGADDLKDAFGLTLTETFAVLDTLVASQQKYGGVITQNRAALVALAPALNAANMSWQEGNELINLANASGVEASETVMGINRALKLLKPGQTLKDLLQSISAIEDPTLRAQRAIEVFGRGGAKLAQLLAPGKGALEDYGLTAEETAGKVDKAAEQINSSWNRRLALAVENVTGFLAEIGNATGPVLSIVGSLGSALSGLSLVAPGALSGLLGKVGLARGQSPATPMFVSDVSGGAGGALGKAGGLGTIAKFVGALGLAAIAVELWQNSLVPLNEANAQQTKTIEQQVKGGIETATTDQLKVQQAALAEGLNKIFGMTAGLGPLQGALFGGQIEGLKADLALVNAELQRREAGKTPVQMGGLSPTERDEQGKVFEAAVTPPLTAMQKQLHDDLVKATDTIRTSNDPKAVAGAIAAVLKSVLGGAGGAKETQALVAELTAKRDAALARGDTVTATLFANAIKQIEPFAKGRQWQQEQIAEARKIVDSNRTTADKVAALRDIQRDLLSHNRKMAADIVGQQIATVQAIDKLPNRLKNALGGILFSGRAPGKEKDDRFVPPKPGSPPKPSPRGPQNSPNPDRGFAAGGFFRPRQPMIVGELRPELLIPDVGGQIVPRVPAAGAGGGNTYNVQVEGLIRARDPFEIATQLRRLGSFGVLTPRRESA